jgi:hypothetical protein
LSFAVTQGFSPDSGSLFQSSFIIFYGGLIIDDKEVKKMKLIFSIFITSLIFISGLDAATIYKWTDEKGVIHFTDQYENVPGAYRDQAKKETVEDSPKTAIVPPSATLLGKDEEVSTSPLGQNETYWRDRARPWKEKLAEAKTKYEGANQKYLEKSEQLSQRRFGSRTQYKMDIIELDKLNVERKKYETEMNEANDALKKISREAEEARANPEWVK